MDSTGSNDGILVSVIIPIYNVEKYINRCVDSVLKQTHRNIEIILIDDGSKDNCGKICDDYLKKDKRVTVIHKENGGLSDARNVGLSKATGEYITFLDADDYIAEYMISELLDLAIKEDCKLVQCEFAKGTENNYRFECANEYIKLSAKDAFESRETKVCVWGKLYHCSLIDGCIFKVGKINEDEFFSYQRVYESGEIVIAREKLYYYFQQTSSITHRKQKYLNTDIIEAYDERIDYFVSKNEKRLVDLSKKEKCIREVLLYVRAKECEDKKIKRDWLRKLYRKEYLEVRRIRFSVKEKIFLEMFYRAPWFVSFLLEKVYV